MLSEKEKNLADVHVEPVPRTKRQRKRKCQQIQSKDCLDEEDLKSDTSDTSKYVNDNVKEDDHVDDKVIDNIKEDIDNDEFIDPDIEIVGGWVYSKEGAFPDTYAIHLLCGGKENGREGKRKCF